VVACHGHTWRPSTAQRAQCVGTYFLTIWPHALTNSTYTEQGGKPLTWPCRCSKCAASCAGLMPERPWSPLSSYWIPPPTGAIEITSHSRYRPCKENAVIQRCWRLAPLPRPLGANSPTNARTGQRCLAPAPYKHSPRPPS